MRAALVGFAAGDLAGGVGYYRGRVPCRMLQEAGRPACVGGSVLMRPGGSALELVQANDYPRVGVEETGPPVAPPVIVLSGIFASHVGAGGIQAAQRDGQAVIVDVDDTLRLPEWHPHRSPGLERARAAAVRAADVVTCGTAELARELADLSARPPVVCPNVIDVADLSFGGPVPWVERRLVVGYRGPVELHRGDLEELGPALRELVERVPGTTFRHVGTTEKLEFAETVGVPVGLVDVRPMRPFDRFMRDLSGCDVAILPSAGTRYTRAKGAQGALEWTLSGVPWVASNHPAIAELVDLEPLTGGVAAFPATPAEWLDRLERFAARPLERELWWRAQLQALAPRVFGLEPSLRAALDVPAERVTGAWLTAVDQAVMRRSA